MAARGEMLDFFELLAPILRQSAEMFDFFEHLE